MEKLKKYNQKLLAIIGTVIIGALGIALISGAAGLIVSAVDFNDTEDHGIQIQNNPTAQGKTDSTKIIRSQSITFHSPIQLDTGYAKYVIPVGQVTLENEETIEVQNRSKKYFSSKYRHNSFNGLFNNFILYDHSSNFKMRIFKDKIAITDWSYLKIYEKELLIFKGTSDDTNLDNQLNKSDYQSLFVYYLSDKKLIPYNFKNKTVLEFQPMPKTNFIAIKIGIDKDKDLEYESRSEPKEILTLDINSRLINDFVSIKMKNELQNKID